MVGETVAGVMELNAWISAFESQLAANVVASRETLTANRLLLDENKLLKEELQRTQRLIEEFHGDHRTLDSGFASDSGPLPQNNNNNVGDFRTQNRR